MKGIGIGAVVLAFGISLLAGTLFGIGWVWTEFTLWRAEYVGQREVITQDYIGKSIRARADNERQARVSQAQAELDAAQKTAEAIRIVGAAAKEYPEYRTQEFIQAFSDAVKSGEIESIIYVPTEAGIPITEAGRVSAK